MDNLAGKPEFAQTQAEMEAQLQQWLTQTSDPFDTGERDTDTGTLLGQRYAHAQYGQVP